MFIESAVEALVDVLGHGVDSRVQLLLHHQHVLLVSVRDQVDGQADLPIATAPAYPVQVGGCVLGEVEVDDHIYTGHVDTTGD